MEPFIGQVSFFAFTFAPRGWAICDGSLINIRQNSALFYLLGTTYGGDGVTTFALPDFRGRVGLHPTTAMITNNAMGGTETATLDLTQIPAHTHQAMGNINNTAALINQPKGNTWATASASQLLYKTPSSTDRVVTMNQNALSPSGNSQAHSNLQPYLIGNYCIAISGIFPSRP